MAVVVAVITFLLISNSRASDSACGVRGTSQAAKNGASGQSSQIIGGQDAQYLEFPWLVNLEKNEGDGTWIHWCGASIINKEYIVLAAHCVEGDKTPSSYRAVLGDFDIRVPDPKQKSIPISEVTQHPDWDPESLSYDYAILKLETPLDFDGDDNAFMPLCLPEQDQEFEVNLNCTASGWGKIDDDHYAQILQEVDLPIVDYELCRQNYANSNPVVKETMICAGFEEGGKSACSGDSGGPLICPKQDGTYVLAGAVSWTVVCAVKYQPSVFSRIATQVDWLKGIAGQTP